VTGSVPPGSPARAPELAALLSTLDDTDPRALTSCPGWTAHHLAAHIAGNYEEVRRHVDAFNDGCPLERTRSWEEREASLRGLDHGGLLGRIADEASATATAIAAALHTEPSAALTWTDRTVSVSGFATHMRSEDALHRWDIAGDDAVSVELLSQPELLAHAVTFIGRPLLERGLRAGAGTETFTGRIRTPGQDDLVIEAGAGQATVSLAGAAGDAVIEGDGAARLLLLWGRKPAPYDRLRQGGQDSRAGLVQALLTGY
jgi:uncharacterized protein (TIGR03083 family)